MNALRESLVTLLGDFHAHRARSMAPAALEENERQRRTLDENAARSRFLKEGDRIPYFELRSIEGATLTSAGLLAEGSLLLIFFRFAGCPACNIALPYYDRHLTASLRASGVNLVAVSPQVPEKLREIKERHQLGLTVANDPGNALARTLGIVFEPDKIAKQAAIANGNLLPQTTGTGTWELPMPAAVLIDRDGIVRFVDVTPDWLARTEAHSIFTAIANALVDRAPVAAL